MNKQMMFCMAFLCLAYTAIAQIQTYTFLFPISYLNFSEKIGTIDTEYNLPLLEGQKGLIYGLYTSGDNARNRVLGEVVLKNIDDNVSVFSFAGNDELELREGDLVALEIDLPMVYHSLIFEMVRLNIKMTSVEDESFLNATRAIMQDDVDFEREVLNELLQEVHYVGSAMKEQSEVFPSITKESRFVGTDIFTAMENSTWEDIRSFLRYIEAKPLIYQGGTWRFAEIYATWLDAGMPSTITDISELLQNATGTDFEKYVGGVSEETLTELTESWRNVAEKYAESGNFDKAFELVNAAFDLGRNSENENIMAWAAYSKANLLEKQGDFEKAIEYFQQSIAFFEKNKDKLGIIVVGNNLGNTYNKLGKYKEALVHLEVSYDIQVTIQNTDNEIINGVGALILRNQGDSYVGLGKYKKALEQYNTGIELLEAATSSKLLIRKASIYLKISELYTIMGETDLAAQYHDKTNALILEIKE